MRFLVAMDARLPADMDDARVQALLAAELERGRELRAAGTIERIWRVPGAQRNVGIWQVPDADALHAAITSLPLYRWLTVDVTPLATHPVEAADA